MSGNPNVCNGNHIWTQKTVDWTVYRVCLNCGQVQAW